MDATLLACQLNNTNVTGDHTYGDPFVSPYPGTTIIPCGKLVPSLGDFIHHFPWPSVPSYEPAYPPYAPNPYVPVQPWEVPVSFVPSSPWRASVVGDSIVLRADVPGVKLETLTVGVEGGVVKASGTRFDTGVRVIMQYFVGGEYDPQSAEAVLEAGVLTVTLKKLVLKASYVVRVTVK